MNKNRKRAFTLIELLVVIAIIAILAGLLAVAAPRALERAKVADVESDFNNIRTALAQYYTDNGSYPPGYGYMAFKSLNRNPTPTPAEQFQLRPYMDMLGFYGTFDLYDRYGLTHDLSGDGEIEWLEYSPLRDVASQQFPNGLYSFTWGTPGPPELLLGAKAQRPYVYIPVYLEHFNMLQNRLKKGATWAAALAGLDSAPPRYNAYVLIGLGPGGNDGGVVTVPSNVLVNERSTWTPILTNLPKDTNTGGQNRYYVLGLRAYYHATLDANENGLLDNDFRARTRNGERGLLPDGTTGLGPMIYVGK